MIQPKVCIFGGTFTSEQVKELKQHCTPIFRLSKQQSTLKEIIRQHRPDVFITIGPESDFPVFNDVSPQERIRWVPYASVSDLMDEKTLLINIMTHAVIEIRDNMPTRKVSVFTTSYNSEKYIHRPLESLLAQTHEDWEWVIYDDSDGDKNWKMLQSVRKRDPARIRIFRSDGNSGNIGNVKQIASSLCRGDFILELDHDDELSPDALENLVGAAERFPDAGFFYSDYLFIHENGDNDEHPDGFAMGFGGYRRQWNDQFDKWVNVSRTVPITDIGVRYLVASPNHFRAWRRSAFVAIGGWDPNFHVADDYEIMARTFLHTTMVRISQRCYTQYVNTPTTASGNIPNNFTNIRNEQIQVIWRSLAQQYNDRFHERIMSLQGSDPYYENWDIDAKPTSVAYHETDEYYQKLNEVYEPRDQNDQYPLVFVVFHYDANDSFDQGSGDSLRQLCLAMSRQTYENIVLMIVSADAEDIVDDVMLRLIKDDEDEDLTEFVRHNVCYWNFVKPDEYRAHPYYMCVNHALKRICTARFAALVYDDGNEFESLSPSFIADSMDCMSERPDIGGVVAPDVPHLCYRTALHKECGYLNEEKLDLLAVLRDNINSNIVDYEAIVSGEEEEEKLDSNTDGDGDDEDDGKDETKSTHADENDIESKNSATKTTPVVMAEEQHDATKSNQKTD